MNASLDWDATYEIALAIFKAHPNVEPEETSLELLYQWVLNLPGFDDDPVFGSDEILAAIYQEWYEIILDNQNR